MRCTFICPLIGFVSTLTQARYCSSLTCSIQSTTLPSSASWTAMVDSRSHRSTGRSGSEPSVDANFSPRSPHALDDLSSLDELRREWLLTPPRASYWAASYGSLIFGLRPRHIAHRKL